MTWTDALGRVNDVLAIKLFEVSGTAVTVATAATVLLVVVATMWTSRIVRKAVRRGFALRGVTDQGTIGLVGNLAHYTVLLVGFGVALQTIGLDLGALFAAGAVFAVGLGFAMQNIAQNFVAGVILMMERAIKPGDVLEVDGTVIRVVNMGIRATIAKTRDGESVLIPNADLVQNRVKNYTLSDSQYRLRAAVGVHYESDLRVVHETLRKVGEAFEGRIEGMPVQVFLREFGSSSVDYELCVWMTDPWLALQTRSSLMERIWWALKDADVTIAFPQIDVHLDGPVEAGVASLAKAG